VEVNRLAIVEASPLARVDVNLLVIADINPQVAVEINPTLKAKVFPPVLEIVNPSAILEASLHLAYPTVSMHNDQKVSNLPAMGKFMYTISTTQNFRGTHNPIQTIMVKHIQEKVATPPVPVRVPAWMEDTKILIQALCWVTANHLTLIEMKDLLVILIGI
jgi:hypothetical protein